MSPCGTCKCRVDGSQVVIACNRKYGGPLDAVLCLGGGSCHLRIFSTESNERKDRGEHLPTYHQMLQSTVLRALSILL